MPKAERVALPPGVAARQCQKLEQCPRTRAKSLRQGLCGISQCNGRGARTELVWDREACSGMGDEQRVPRLAA